MQLPAEVQAVDDLREFHEVAKKAAYKITAIDRGSTDALALGREDYEMQLLVSAWEARKRFRSDSFTSPHDSERRYCFQAIWNAARTMHGIRARSGFVPMLARGELPDIIDPDEDIETRYNAAESLALLRQHFSDAEWRVFERLADAQGNVLASYHGSGLESEISASTWFDRVVKLRKRAKKLLGEE